MFARLSVHHEPILSSTIQLYISNSMHIRLLSIGFLNSHPSPISLLVQSLTHLTTVTMTATPPCFHSSSLDMLYFDALLTMTSHVSSDSPESPILPKVLKTLALTDSLLYVIKYLNTASDTFLETVASKNNSKPLQSVMLDNADYWIKSSGKSFFLKFPAKIDCCGQFWVWIRNK